MPAEADQGRACGGKRNEEQEEQAGALKEQQGPPDAGANQAGIPASVQPVLQERWERTEAHCGKPHIARGSDPKGRDGSIECKAGRSWNGSCRNTGKGTDWGVRNDFRRRVDSAGRENAIEQTAAERGWNVWEVPKTDMSAAEQMVLQLPREPIK